MAGQVSGAARFVETFFDAQVMETYLPAILSGVQVTVTISLAVIVAGTLAGLALACLRSYGWRWINLAIICFADIGRALPPLVVILLCYFGLPNIGIVIPGPMVLFLVLSATLAAFAEEIFWAGFTSVPRGQWEAGRATGLGFGETLVFVALPQAVRLAVPPLVNRAIATSKMTALGSVIGVAEILSQATTAQSFSGSATPLTMGAIAYLAIFVPLVIAARWIERRFRWTRA